jgi:phage gp36-like protein
MYASVSDLQQRFSDSELVSLTDRMQTGVIDTELLQGRISSASARMDSYLAGRYSLPLAQVPVVLVDVCADLVRYSLYDQSVPEVVKSRFDDAVRFLEQVSKGAVQLQIQGLGPAAQPENLIVIESDGHVFGRRNSKGFI